MPPDAPSHSVRVERRPGSSRARVWLVIASVALLAACAASPRDATPQPTASALEAADALLAAGSYTAAAAAYERALAASPLDPEPALRLADLYLAWSRPADGLSALDRAAARGAPDTEISRRHIELLVMAGDWIGVIDRAQSLLLDTPDDVEALQALGRAYLSLGRCAEATGAAREAIAAHPERIDIARTSAALRGAYGELAELAPALMLGLEDCSPACDRLVGLRLARAEEWGLAVCILERAVAAAPDDADARVWLGEAYARLGLQSGAYRHLRLAVDLNPESPQAWLLLGKHLLTAGETEQARISLLNAQKLDPMNPAPCLAMAELKAQMGLYEEVGRWTGAALDRADDDAEVWKAVARFYLIRRLANEALVLSAAERATELNPQDAAAHMLLGWAQFLRGNQDAALAALDQAVAIAPTLAEAHHWRGIALEAAGRAQEAEDALILAADLGYRTGAP